jgi:LacI family transcriptional regulator
VKVNITSIATAAGVSPTTVSHTLSGNRTVAPSTRQRVLAAIDELGYQPDRIAQSLRRRSTLSVALLVTDLSNPYYPSMAKALHRTLDDEGYALLIGETEGTARGERRLLDEMVSRRVDAVVIHPLAMTTRDLRDAVGSVPLVVLGGQGEAPDQPVDLILTDDQRGIDEAILHLLDRGHSEIAFVGGPPETEHGAGRVAAFRHAVVDHGLDVGPGWIEHAPFTRDGGFEAMRRILDRDRPRAVMCANDLIAIGVLDALREAGHRTPADVAVVGFDDIDVARLLTPQLTTVRNPATDVGRACAEAILHRLAEPDAAPTVTRLPTTLQIRQTT